MLNGRANLQSIPPYYRVVAMPNHHQVPMNPSAWVEMMCSTPFPRCWVTTTTMFHPASESQS